IERGTALTAKSVSLEHCPDVAIAIAGLTTTATLTDIAISDTTGCTADVTLTCGELGISIRDSNVRIDRARLLRTGGLGVAVLGADARTVLSDIDLEGTPAAKFPTGFQLSCPRVFHLERAHFADIGN